MDTKPKLLLVDDDEGFLKANALLLEQAGYNVVTAPDGRAGLAAARQHKPDVAIIDVIMKQPDEGFRLARAIHNDPDLADVKMIVLTAVGEQYQMLFEPDEQWLPVAKVLDKLTTGDELLAEISSLLGASAGNGG